MGSQRMRALGAAFPRTLPVMAGFLFLGLAWGIVLREKGFGPEWALLISAAVYAGSMQFAMLGLMTAPFSPVTTVMMTLLVNARHLFYGLTMLEPYGKVKRGKPYLIFSLTDETFSLVCGGPYRGTWRRRTIIWPFPSWTSSTGSQAAWPGHCWPVSALDLTGIDLP